LSCILELIAGTLLLVDYSGRVGPSMGWPRTMAA
jgi:hypothetical protein